MSNCETGFSSRTVILSAAIGAIAGVAALLLLAPKARRESGVRIRGLSHDLNERVTATIGSARKSVSSTISRHRDDPHAVSEVAAMAAPAAEARP